VQSPGNPYYHVGAAIPAANRDAVFLVSRLVTSRRLMLLVCLVAAMMNPVVASATVPVGSVSGPASGDGAWVQRGDSTLRQSAHAKLVCVACHTSLDPRNVPLSDGVAPVNCLRCHAGALFKHDFHPELARAIRANREPLVTCKRCHGAHDVTAVRLPGSQLSPSRLAESCTACHPNAAERFSIGPPHDTTSLRSAPLRPRSATRAAVIWLVIIAALIGAAVVFRRIVRRTR